MGRLWMDSSDVVSVNESSEINPTIFRFGDFLAPKKVLDGRRRKAIEILVLGTIPGNLGW